MGLEPTTFCMAISSALSGCDSGRDISLNQANAGIVPSTSGCPETGPFEGTRQSTIRQVPRTARRESSSLQGFRNAAANSPIAIRADMRRYERFGNFGGEVPKFLDGGSILYPAPETQLARAVERSRDASQRRENRVEIGLRGVGVFTHAPGGVISDAQLHV